MCTFIHFKKFQACFKTAQEAGCTFKFVDEEGEEDVVTNATQFSELAKGVEICALEIKLPNDTNTSIQFVTDNDEERGVYVEANDWGERSETYFKDYLDSIGA